MPAVEATPVSSSESGLVKMEDRKRPAGHDQNDAAPPSKRQATAVNGNKPHPDADMPWKDDLEVRLYSFRPRVNHHCFHYYNVELFAD
jgi:E3 ubiquitin-protein ligase BRE1